MTRKRISISIPVFNEQAYILSTLQRFLEQNYPKKPFELIIVNNNSTDKTELLVKKFAKKNLALNIKLVKEKRQGQIYARKKGLDLGRQATYLFTLDGESLVPPNFISQSVDILQKRNADGVAWKLRLPWDIFLNFPKEMRGKLAFFIQKKDIIQSFLQSYFGPILDGSSFVITNSIYKKIGGIALSGGPLRYDDDIILGRRILYNGGRIASSSGYVTVSGRRMLADIKGYLAGTSHWGEKKLWFPREQLKDPPYLSEKDFDFLWEKRLKISAEIFLRFMLDAMLYYQQHPQNKVVKRYIKESTKLCQASLESCFSMIEGIKWKEAFDILKDEFQTKVEQEIRLYVQKEIPN